MRSVRWLKSALTYAAISATGVIAGVAVARLYGTWSHSQATREQSAEMTEFLFARIEGIAVGQTFPDVPLWSLADSRTLSPGEVLRHGGMLYYISLQCGSCKAAVASLQAARPKGRLGRHDILLVAVGTAAEAQGFASQHSIEFPVLVDTTKTLPMDYGVRAFPVCFCLDSAQTVLAVQAEMREAADIERFINDCAERQ